MLRCFLKFRVSRVSGVEVFKVLKLVFVNGFGDAFRLCTGC